MYWGWRPYVPAAKRRLNAQKAAAKLVKKGQKVLPVNLTGRTIAKTFWGKAWCEHLESFSDYENRLPRGRTYVRNGSVIHLNIEQGFIDALVQGSSLYKVKIEIKTLDGKKWEGIVSRCSGEIASVIELLQGKFSSGVMKAVIDRDKGLFPAPKEIKLKCSCPDWAEMCKHVAAVLYGVGHRLDNEPELLFKLRKVDHLELINKAGLKVPKAPASRTNVIKEDELSEIFGIDIAKGAAIKTSVLKRPLRKKRKGAGNLS